MIAIQPARVHDELRQGEVLKQNCQDSVLASKHFYIESYGCAMNLADSEVVAAILRKENMAVTESLEDADLIFINTCAVREKAEMTVRKRLTEFRKYKKKNPGLLIGVLGCMAERIKAKFLEEEKLVDIVVGPDAYRSLPSLIKEAESGQKGVDVLLSREETYGDIAPIRLNSNGVTAFVSIMRGCNNMCSFCVVPFTRGRERSRNMDSIIRECTDLVNEGYREVTLLGQNVDSYQYFDPVTNSTVSFAMLLEKVAQVSPLLRVRFSTSHPKDITDEVLFTMIKYDNICKNIHLPVQSGSTRILQLMNRTYTREWYLAKVSRIREIIPECGLSTDTISGFCTETEEDHQDTMSLFKDCHFDLAYMYYYSVRPGTLAARRFEDDVPLEVKKRRLAEIVDLHRECSYAAMQKELGRTLRVLIEGESKKSKDHWAGRCDSNKMVVFPRNGKLNKGDYANVLIKDCTPGTLLGEAI
jgi:tRNA-2-methylthio-N6-dimethylallyladenosine synthase